MTDHKPAQPFAAPKLLLLNDAALGLPPACTAVAPGETALVAGPSRVRLALAELALPGIIPIWTDFRRSASLTALLANVRTEGVLRRLVLAANGENAEDVFAVMRTILTFLPSLRKTPEAEVRLFVSDGPAKASLTAFLRRFSETGLPVHLKTAPASALRLAA